MRCIQKEAHSASAPLPVLRGRFEEKKEGMEVRKKEGRV